MINLDQLYHEGRYIVKECCGDVIETIESVSINNRAKKRWGCCKYIYEYGEKRCSIEISSEILRDEIPYDKALTVMVHELLHATTGTKGHGKLWKRRANQVMQKYPNLLITRCTEPKYFGIDSSYIEKYRKYAIACEQCGSIHTSSRMSKSIMHPERYRCVKCQGRFKRIKLAQTALF